jgi:hypothetical protein
VAKKQSAASRFFAAGILDRRRAVARDARTLHDTFLLRRFLHQLRDHGAIIARLTSF